MFSHLVWSLHYSCEKMEISIFENMKISEYVIIGICENENKWIIFLNSLFNEKCCIFHITYNNVDRCRWVKKEKSIIVAVNGFK